MQGFNFAEFWKRNHETLERLQAMCSGMNGLRSGYIYFNITNQVHMSDPTQMRE